MKVYPFKIPKKPNENIVLQIDRPTHFYDKLHQHEEIQLSYIVSGKGKLLVGNGITTFEPGDFVAIGSNLPHVFQSEKDSQESHMITLFFLKDSFGKNFFDNQEMLILNPIFESLGYGFKVMDKDNYFDHLFSNLRNENKFELFQKLLELLHHLLYSNKTLLLEDGYPTKISNNQGERLQLIFDHVMKHFDEAILLKDVSDSIHMSRNAFCRFFKQRTNKTFFQFLSEVRIQHACGLLTDFPDFSIAEVAYKSGYSSISNFNRQFKEIKGISPSGYRKQLE